MDEFKCILCHQIPPDIVYRCCQGHMFCCGCAHSNHYLCTVGIQYYSSALMGHLYGLAD